MIWIGLVVWAAAVVGLLCLLGRMDYEGEALQRAVRPVSRCYIEGDTEAEIVETLLRGLAKEATV